MLPDSAPVAQGIEYWPPKPRVVGSIPAGRAIATTKQRKGVRHLEGGEDGTPILTGPTVLREDTSACRFFDRGRLYYGIPRGNGKRSTVKLCLPSTRQFLPINAR